MTPPPYGNFHPFFFEPFPYLLFQLLGYNPESSRGFPECANMEKIAEHLKFWFQLVGGSLDNVVGWLSKLTKECREYVFSCSYTGCHIPCSYTRYFAAGVNFTLISHYHYQSSISGASATLWQREEYRVHVRLLHQRGDRQGGGLHLPAAVLRVRVRWIPRPLRRILIPHNLGLDTLASQMLHSSMQTKIIYKCSQGGKKIMLWSSGKGQARKGKERQVWQKVKGLNA